MGRGGVSILRHQPLRSGTGPFAPVSRYTSKWTADGIKRVAETFLDLEAELFDLRRDLELNWFEADWPYLE
jgi:hypothetical protein